MSTEPIDAGAGNEALRRDDWRFLLRQSGAPGRGTLVVTGFPRARTLRAARAALADGGEVLCVWRRPRLRGVQRARSRLRRARFDDVALYWPGPSSRRAAEFWLPLEEPRVLSHLLARRPTADRRRAILRPLWRAAEPAGVLAPVYAIARYGGAGDPDSDAFAELLAGRALLLLSPGWRRISKVVGLAFGPGETDPDVLVKFSRVAATDAAVEREGEVLGRLGRERPDLRGVPRLLATGRRAGRSAVAQSRLDGPGIRSLLTPDTFEDLAGRVTRWLISLAGSPSPQPAERWERRLVTGPLDRFEEIFGPVTGEDTVRRVRDLLSGLGELPLVWEHRDCGPWNLVLGADGQVAAVDWETSEPHGLPCTDLAYFLAGSLLDMEGAFAGRVDHDLVARLHARLLDPSTPEGAVAERCVARYCHALGIDQALYPRLRLLAWVVLALIDYEHLAMEAGGDPPERDVRGIFFLALIAGEVGVR
ncbi:MAG TPA: aminoglycoside phosphotransferase family protein [Solirubrobacterales bacterium]|nr:aminoglycoside phosphotransferase family protein [Solirubrobacterales bacterium]